MDTMGGASRGHLIILVRGDPNIGSVIYFCILFSFFFTPFSAILGGGLSKKPSKTGAWMSETICPVVAFIFFFFSNYRLADRKSVV